MFPVMHRFAKTIKNRIKSDCMKKTHQVTGHFALSHERRKGIIKCINKIISTILADKPMCNPNDYRGLKSIPFMVYHSIKFQNSFLINGHSENHSTSSSDHDCISKFKYWKINNINVFCAVKIFAFSISDISDT
jgi:hypothetical protein